MFGEVYSLMRTVGVAQNDGVVAEQQDVFQLQRAPGQAQQQVLTSVGFQQRYLTKSKNMKLMI
jgi:hypothetical protein